MLNKIDWNKIQEKAKEWTVNLTGFLNGVISGTDWNLVGSTLGESFNTILTSAITFFETFDWAEFGKSIADQIDGAIDTIEWDTLAQTLSSGILGMLDSTTTLLKETDWSELGSAIGEFLINIDWIELYKTINYELLPAFLASVWQCWCGLLDGLGITEYWTDVFFKAWNGVKNAWNGAKNFFKIVWSGIKGAFGNVTDWFKTTFKNAWTAVKNVFSTGGKIFEGIKEGISSVFKTVVNGLIDGINTVIAVPFEKINGMLNSIRDVGIGDMKPFKDLWEENPLPVPQIPKLATGTVVPANYGEFTAILGDNKREPEIVSPLSTMKQAMREVLEEMGVIGGNGNIEYRFVAELNGKPIFEEVVTQDKIDRKRHGGRSRLGTVR